MIITLIHLTFSVNYKNAKIGLKNQNTKYKNVIKKSKYKIPPPPPLYKNAYGEVLCEVWGFLYFLGRF
jgi:hypothetical protein